MMFDIMNGKENHTPQNKMSDEFSIYFNVGL